MKKIILISALLFSFNGWAEDSVYIRGEMICTIKDQVVLTMRDGKSERYGSIEGGFTIGDKATFAYEITDSDIGVIVFHDTEDKDSKKDTLFLGLYEPKTALDLGSVIVVDSFSKADNLYVSEDMFDAGYENTRLSLQRYFKNDWNGIVTYTVSGLSMTSTLDCRQQINQYENYLQRLRELTTSKP